MSSAKRFEDLDVWQRSREVANMIYRTSEAGAFAHDYGLRDQMRRAAVSVMSNIAEGFESQTQALFVNYLGRAKGSSGELRSQLYIALDRSYINQEEFNRVYAQAEICSKQLARFIKYLETQPNARRLSEEEAYYDVEP